MDELILRELQGIATDIERAELARWRQASPDHERSYQEISALWALLGTRSEIEPASRVPSADDILRPTIVSSHEAPARGPETTSDGRGAASHHQKAASRHLGSVPFRQWVTPAVAAAAVVIALLGIGRIADVWPGARPDADAAVRTITTTEYETGPNELTTAVLDDGTVARLGPNTRLRAVIGGAVREVQLDGRAFFAVTHDPEHPFEVTTDAGGARVLGTRFELDSRRDRIRLIVVDGAVALSAAGSEVRLGVGEIGEASSGAGLSVSRVDVPEKLLDWVGGWVAFEATPLRQVAIELEARLGLNVVIADSAIAERTITGWFSEDERGQILAMVCRVAEVRCTEVGDSILVES